MRLTPEYEIPLGEVAKTVVGIPIAASKEVDKRQLAIGILVELEHTDDPKEAEAIARDHLEEDGAYYTKPMKRDWGADEAKDRIQEITRAASFLGRLSKQELSKRQMLVLDFLAQQEAEGITTTSTGDERFPNQDKSVLTIVESLVKRGLVDMVTEAFKNTQGMAWVSLTDRGRRMQEQYGSPITRTAFAIKTAAEGHRHHWHAIPGGGTPRRYCFECKSFEVLGGDGSWRPWDEAAWGPHPSEDEIRSLVAGYRAEMYGSAPKTSLTASSVFLFEDDPERIEIFRKAFGSDNVVVTSKVDEALGLLRTGNFSRLYLDHDVSNPKENGEDLAWQMERERLASSTPVVIHSENTRGQRVMARYLGKYHSNVTVTPFRQLRRQLDIPGRVL